MRVKFWGTRGSLPQATNHDMAVQLIESTVKAAEDLGILALKDLVPAIKDGRIKRPLSYGGNTTCTEVIDGNQSYFIDMGSGLREAGTAALQAGRKDFTFFMTHVHWDHVMGLPFFVPIYTPGVKITIYHVHKNAPDHIKINFNGINFPLTWEQLQAQIEFKQLKLYEICKLGGDKQATVSPFVLDHPGGSFGYRFDSGGKSVAIGVDGEFKRVAPKDLGKDLKYYQRLDMLVFDAQYEMSELASRFDWGHCSPNIGVDLAVREGIRSIAFTHHDPWATPAKLQRMFANAQTHLKAQVGAFKDVWEPLGQDGPRLISAYDGLEVEV